MIVIISYFLILIICDDYDHFLFLDSYLLWWLWSLLISLFLPFVIIVTISYFLILIFCRHSGRWWWLWDCQLERVFAEASKQRARREALIKTMRISPTIAFRNRCKVALIRSFLTVGSQMCLQMSCLSRCTHTLVAFVRFSPEWVDILSGQVGCQGDQVIKLSNVGHNLELKTLKN